MIEWHFCIACGKPTGSKIPRCEECQKKVEDQRKKIREVFGFPYKRGSKNDG